MAKPFSGVAMSREMKCGGGRLLGRLPMSSRLRACASPASGAVLVIGVYRVQVRFASDEENIAYMVFLFFFASLSRMRLARRTGSAFR